MITVWHGVKKWLWIAVWMTGCVAEYNPGKGPPEPEPAPRCDVQAADWANTRCETVQSSGTYGPDTRYVCPQADGTEWGLRIAYDQNGKIAGEYYEKYTVWGGVTPHLPKCDLCLVDMEDRVIVDFDPKDCP